MSAAQGASLKYGVPQPFQFEAPSAWLTRLAFAQGIGDFGELRQFLGLPAQGDLDWHLQGKALDELRQRCRLPASSFAISSRLMQGVALSRLGPHKLLLSTKDGEARFRFCPCCLAERSLPYLDIHWRFACWRWCPIHDAVLQDACPDCDALVQHPYLIESTRAGRAGHASLSRCIFCSGRLAGMLVQKFARECLQVLGDVDQLWLKNGQATMAALYQQHFNLRGKWHLIQRLGDEYGLLVGLGGRHIDRKLEVWRSTRELHVAVKDPASW
ncbi:TniQ family protein [Kinneretia aquatilis]|uniref:TniQ family protein n=1 Tax=Kinneretia aquatilis TaxID=2070761 RepID=UPI001495266A|nr:TniQ family protein [Paucibacter aquatile]WIV97493.1 TniQ family protein [Paucibacter aquatile]